MHIRARLMKNHGTAGQALGCAALLAFLAGPANGQTSWKFDFGSGPAAPGYTQVLPTATYPGTGGFGFEKSSGITSVNRGGDDPLRGDYVTSSSEIRFSVKVPQGNYNVTFILGDAAGTSSTTVTAENLRLLLDRATTASGQFLTRTFTLNRREVRSTDGTVTMSIKDRELTYLTWDDRLTLRFAGPKTALAGIEITKVENALNVFLCGNSTVVDQLDEDASNMGWRSWGQIIPMFFKPGVAIANYAESGLKAGDFLAMRRLDKVLAEAKAGDYVFVEFGHNDQGDGATPYVANLKTFHTRIKAKGAVPIFVSPTCRNGDNNPLTSIGGLAEAMRKTAAELGAPLVDLNAKSITLMGALGSNRSAAYMDVSHFRIFGAFELARIMAKGIKDMNNSLAPFLLNELPDFDPAKPDPINYFTTPGVVSLAPVRRSMPARGLDGEARPLARGRSLMIHSPRGWGGAEFLTDGKRLATEPAREQRAD